MNWTKNQLLKMRRNIHLAAVSLSDENAAETPEMFERWETDHAYTMGERVCYIDKLYRCEQAHTSQEDRAPAAAPALWTEIAKPGEIPVWRQPTGAQDAYRIGDKVRYPDADGPVYECTIDYNVYAPDVAGWKLKEE